MNSISEVKISKLKGTDGKGTQNPQIRYIKWKMQLKRNPLIKNLLRNYEFYLMLLPVIAYFIIFKYIPMYGVLIAFKDFNIFKGIWNSDWVGLEVFREVFRDKTFWRALTNTLRLNLLSLIVNFPAPIILALLMNEIRAEKFKRVVQSISYMPHFISWVILYGIMLTFLNKNTGLINVFLKNIGLEQINFLTEKKWWIIVYLGSAIWKEVGWSTIIYLAALTSIDPTLYEAAIVDGAGRFRCMWHITLPGIKSTIIIMLILRVGQTMSIGFEQPFLLGNAKVMDIAEVLSTYIYKMGIINARFSFTTAVGLFQSVVNFILLFIVNSVARALGEQDLWGGKKIEG